MLKVFFVSDDEFDRNTYGWGGRACNSYVINRQDQKIDTNKLNETEILSFIWQGIHQAVAEYRQATHTPDEKFDLAAYPTAIEVRNLVFLVDHYCPTQTGVNTLSKLLYHQDKIVRQFAKLLVTPLFERGRKKLNEQYAANKPKLSPEEMATARSQAFQRIVDSLKVNHSTTLHKEL